MTCVSYGDKAIGTNHVLPTLGAARYTGGLWVGKYLKTVTYQEIDNAESSAELGRICGRAARLENFEGHARSADVRAAKFGGDALAVEQPCVRSRGQGAGALRHRRCTLGTDVPSGARPVKPGGTRAKERHFR